MSYRKYYKVEERGFQFLLRDLGRNNGENIRKMAVDQKKVLSYNIFDKRAVGQCTPDRRIKLLTKIAPNFTRAGALF